MALAIEDPAEVEVERDGKSVLVPGTWRPPGHRIMPELIEQARAFLEERLKPGGEPGVRKALAALMLTTIPPATEGMSDETMAGFMAAKASEYQRLLADVPADLLERAADKCARESEFFPTVAGLLKHVTPELEKRRRQRDRLGRLLEAANKPATKPAPPPFVAEPRDVILGTLIKAARARGQMDKAMRYERELAEFLGREVEEWARIDAPLEPSNVGEKLNAAPKPKAREWKRPDAWQAGAPLYQPGDEPPPPIDIPEASELEP